MDKKTWIKPELVSLTRCRPEEAVLSACKYGGLYTDPLLSCVGCLQHNPIGEECHSCDQVAVS